jgi:peroxiredoxin
LKGKPIEVMGILVKDTPEKAKAYLKAEKITYPNLIDKDSSVAQRLGIRGVPSIVLVDRKGIIRYQGYKLPERDVIDKVL